MSDQMPDEVWVEVCNDALEAGLSKGRGRTRYIRTDRYEQAEAERDDAKARVEHLLTEICGGAANRHALAERCREVAAERDRLRAAIEAAIAVLRNDLYTTRVRNALADLEEALDHD